LVHQLSLENGSKNEKVKFIQNERFKIMPFIIAEPCVGTCDTACVEVCPVDCIHGPEIVDGRGEEAKVNGFNPDGKQLYIDPLECIDCGACEPECPVEAIFEETELPAEWEKYIEINAKFFE
jgi:ferredoxin